MSSEQQEMSYEEQTQAQRRLSAQQHADRIGIQTQQEEVSERKYDPGFFAETSELDADTEMFPWMENVSGSKASKAHVMGNMPEAYAEQQQYLNMNQGERMIAEQDMGYLLKKNKPVAAVYQDARDVSLNANGKLVYEDEDLIDPIELDRRRRAYRDLSQLWTVRESLAVQARYFDGLTTATTESRVQDTVEEEASGTKRRLRGALQ